MDFLSLEPDSSNTKDILVLTDHFTKFAVAIPTTNQKAKTVAKCLWNDFMVYYGIPERLHSDQGPDFESRLIKELCEVAGIQKTRTTPYHPRGNPVERFNRTLLGMLGTLENKQKSKWKDYVKPLVHAYNCTRNEVTGFTPYELLFGRSPRLPVDLAFGLPVREPLTSSHSQYVKSLKDRLQESYKAPYGKAVDMWSVGCILGELSDGQPLFPGESEIDQLFTIQKVLGPLPAEQMKLFYNNPRFHGIRFPSVTHPQTLERRYQGIMSGLMLDLMKNLLLLNPTERYLTDQSLNHPVFQPLRQVERESQMYYVFLFSIRSHSKSTSHRRSNSKECSSLPRHGDLHHLGNDNFLNGNKGAPSSLSPTLHPKTQYLSQTLNRSASSSKDLINNNILPHLLSPKDKTKEFDFNLGPSPKLSDLGHGVKYGHSKTGSTRHTFLEGKTNTLQSAPEKHGRHGHTQSSASYLSLSKSHSALSDAKSVGNLSDTRLHPDDPNANPPAVGPGARFFPTSCLDLNTQTGPQGPPGSPSNRHSDRSGHSPASRSGGNIRLESSTLDSSSRHKSRHKSLVPGELLDPAGPPISSTHTLPSPHESYHYGLGYTSPFSSQQRPQRHSMYVRRERHRPHGTEGGAAPGLPVPGQAIPTRASSLQLLSPQLHEQSPKDMSHPCAPIKESSRDNTAAFHSQRSKNEVSMYHDPHGEDGVSKENRMIFTESMPRRVGSFYRGMSALGLRCVLTIHPSIFFRLSGAGSRGQQSKQVLPDFPHLRHVLQLLRWDSAGIAAATSTADLTTTTTSSCIDNRGGEHGPLRVHVPSLPRDQGEALPEV
uniref:Integrase catalytic domain-containing protein n=1 Tax=Periophthalmus magnuspinnatus TaxID=409849 RepID=A0A3B3ZI88_9GOBI